MTTPLTDVLTPTARKLVYQIYVLIGFLIGATQAAYAALPDQDVPRALFVALALFGYVGIALGVTAASNVTTKSGNPV